MAKGKAVSLRDDQLLQAAANGWSGQEIQDAYGVPAAQAIVRVKELLAARDVWTEVEQRKLLLSSAYSIKEKLEKNLDTDDPKAVEAYTKVMRTVGDMLDRQSKISDSELETVSKVQARYMMAMIQAGYEHARRMLADEYQNVDLDRIDEAFKEGMRGSLLEINE